VTPPLRFTVALASGLIASTAVAAFADDAGMDMSGMDMSGADMSGMNTKSSGETATASRFALTAGVSLVAAAFSTMYYPSGSYEGAIPSVEGSYGRVSAGVALPLYHLDANGLGGNGLGDAMIHGAATLVTSEHASFGAMAMVSVPTGDTSERFGMGAVMLMPSLWGMTTIGHVTVSASAGYSAAIGGRSDVDMHGMMALVDPMNMSEITWSGGAEYAIGAGVRAGARLTGGIPIADPGGVERVIAGGHVAWGRKQLQTSAEIQAGLAGDPFSIRAVISTALRF